MGTVLEAVASGAVSGLLSSIVYKFISDELALKKTEWTYKHSLVLDVVSTIRSTARTYNALLSKPNTIPTDQTDVAIRANLANLNSSRIVGTPALKIESVLEKIRDTKLRRWIMLYYHSLDTLKSSALTSESTYAELIKMTDEDAKKNTALETHRVDVFNEMQRRMLVYAFMSAVYGVHIVERALSVSGYDCSCTHKDALERDISLRYGLGRDALRALVSRLATYDGNSISADEARTFGKLTLGRD